MILNDMQLAVGVPKAAWLLGISKSNLWALIARNEIPVCKIGSRTLIRTADLTTFVAERTATRGQA